MIAFVSYGQLLAEHDLFAGLQQICEFVRSGWVDMSYVR
ncbi:hypothetical protein JOD54_000870 [Actinokineospora baliensis]|nr:hypothetical protein [Actinokineospora baliensis]